MAIGSTAAPQAYTREVLTTAFNWLQSQPDSVRRQATTPDSLVALYMRAQRHGTSNLTTSLQTEAPVSSQNFMSDLKNLAEGLKQFEDPQARAQAHGQSHTQTLAQPTPQPETQQPVHQPAQQLAHQNLSTPAQAFSHGQMAPNFSNGNRQQVLGAFPAATAQQAATRSISVETYSTTAFSGAATVSAAQLGLSERSLQMLEEVKSNLNLTSDAETINLMLALAYKNLKTLLA